MMRRPKSCLQVPRSVQWGTFINGVARRDPLHLISDCQAVPRKSGPSASILPAESRHRLLPAGARPLGGVCPMTSVTPCLPMPAYIALLSMGQGPAMKRYVPSHKFQVCSCSVSFLDGLLILEADNYMKLPLLQLLRTPTRCLRHALFSLACYWSNSLSTLQARMPWQSDKPEVSRDGTSALSMSHFRSGISILYPVLSCYTTEQTLRGRQA